VAYAARKAGVPCSVVVIETAPASKVERMRRLGAKLIPVPFDVAWNAMEERAFDGAEGTFIHPFDDQNFVTGNATIGLEILEDAPDVVAVIAAIGGGGLITGLGSAVKALKPKVKSLGSGTGNGGAGRIVVRETIAAGLHRVEAIVCRWGGGQKYFPADVGTDEAGIGWFNCR
jgi:Threonine dehydratase